MSLPDPGEGKRVRLCILGFYYELQITEVNQTINLSYIPSLTIFVHEEKGRPRYLLVFVILL